MNKHRSGTDPRYKEAGIALKDGRIGSFAEIFQIVPGIIVAKDWGINLNIFNLVMIDDGILPAVRYVELAEWMDYPPLELINLATAHYKRVKERPIRKRQ